MLDPLLRSARAPPDIRRGRKLVDLCDGERFPPLHGDAQPGRLCARHWDDPLRRAYAAQDTVAGAFDAEVVRPTPTGHGARAVGALARQRQVPKRTAARIDRSLLPDVDRQAGGDVIGGAEIVALDDLRLRVINWMRQRESDVWTVLTHAKRASMLYLDIPPEAGAIRQVFIWIGIHDNGQEAMISADLPTPFGIRHMDLMSSRRDLAEKFEPLARRIQQQAQEAGRTMEIELRTFRAQPATLSAGKKV